MTLRRYTATELYARTGRGRSDSVSVAKAVQQQKVQRAARRDSVAERRVSAHAQTHAVGPSGRARKPVAPPAAFDHLTEGNANVKKGTGTCLHSSYFILHTVYFTYVVLGNLVISFPCEGYGKETLKKRKRANKEAQKAEREHRVAHVPKKRRDGKPLSRRQLQRAEGL